MREHHGRLAKPHDLLLRQKVGRPRILLRTDRRVSPGRATEAAVSRRAHALLAVVSSSRFSARLSSFTFSMAARWRRMTVCASSQYAFRLFYTAHGARQRKVVVRP